MDRTARPRRGAPPLTAAADLNLDDATVAQLLALLPEMATQTVRAIIDEVPAYENALAGPLGATITTAVEIALRGFLRLAGKPSRPAARDAMTPALAGAYNLGRGEARGGRTMDALLTAYRVGARESWRQFSRTALDAGVSAVGMARFAELVFTYIDGLSAASAAGHADELATTGRVRERYLNRLTIGILSGQSAEDLAGHAARADWEPPGTLSAVILDSGSAAAAVAKLDERTLRADEELPDLDSREQPGTTVLLVANADGQRRPAIVRSLAEVGAYLGPPRPWTHARTSYLRALRARRLQLPLHRGVCDTEEHLPTLVVTADPEALTDLRRSALAPLRELRPATVDRLTETLRAWVIHQGRRDDVAEALHIHPQTVRYRVSQLREHFGSRFDDPDTVTALTIALTVPPPALAADTTSGDAAPA